ncbi:MAG: hypothetical protein ABSC19_07370, partial [Syntrophorhabdales bacterium]
RAAMPSVSLMGQGNAARRKDFLLEGGHCAIIGIFFSAANNQVLTCQLESLRVADDLADMAQRHREHISVGAHPIGFIVHYLILTVPGMG